MDANKNRHIKYLSSHWTPRNGIYTWNVDLLIYSNTDKTMTTKHNILAIIGSASSDSANLKLVEKLVLLSENTFHVTIFQDLKLLPHFDPELSINNPPISIQKFRKSIDQADGVIICTPEYVFSIPSGLKNAIEWCIATTVFSGKPVGLITASGNGQK